MEESKERLIGKTLYLNIFLGILCLICFVISPLHWIFAIVAILSIVGILINGINYLGEWK